MDFKAKVLRCNQEKTEERNLERNVSLLFICSYVTAKSTIYNAFGKDNAS